MASKAGSTSSSASILPGDRSTGLPSASPIPSHPTMPQRAMLRVKAAMPNVASSPLALIASAAAWRAAIMAATVTGFHLHAGITRNVNPERCSVRLRKFEHESFPRMLDQ